VSPLPVNRATAPVGKMISTANSASAAPAVSLISWIRRERLRSGWALASARFIGVNRFTDTGLLRRYAQSAQPAAQPSSPGNSNWYAGQPTRVGPWKIILPTGAWRRFHGGGDTGWINSVLEALRPSMLVYRQPPGFSGGSVPSMDARASMVWSILVQETLQQEPTSGFFVCLCQQSAPSAQDPFLGWFWLGALHQTVGTRNFCADGR